MNYKNDKSDIVRLVITVILALSSLVIMSFKIAHFTDVFGLVSIVIETVAVLLCVIFMVSCIIDKENTKDENKRMISFLFAVAISQCSEALSWAFDGMNPSKKLEILIYITNAICYVANLRIIYTFIIGLEAYMPFKQTWVKFFKKAGVVYSLLLAIALIINYWFPFIFTVSGGEYKPLSAATLTIIVAMAFIVLFSVLVHREDIDKVEKVSLVAFILIPTTASVLQVFCGSFSIMSLAILICTVIAYVNCHIRQEQILHQKRIALQQQQTSVMLSQIQPHFLFNSLNTIVALCDMDPKLAKQATLDFSDYLEHNLNSISEEKPISFESELKHVKAYLKIEQLRFGKYLNVVYDIQTTNFRIPSLTVQPIVENAVKHGIMKKPEGGTVTISTYETDDFYCVKVLDNGIGFDSAKPEVINHGVGIANIKTRLSIQSQGLLKITSAVGIGTTAIIQIPKEFKL